MHASNDPPQIAAAEAIDARELLKAIRVICGILLAGSGFYALAAALKIPKFTEIFREMLGDTEMPLGTGLLFDYPALWMVIPFIITLIGFWLLLKVRSAHRSLYFAAGLILLNILTAMFIDWALFQPLISIITQFAPS